MPIVGPVLERLGWRSADLISPHPPEDCRRRIGEAIGPRWGGKLPASGRLQSRSAVLYWIDDRSAGTRSVVLLMGQPILSVRWTSDGVGTRLRCRSGVSWVVIGIWIAVIALGVALKAASSGVSQGDLSRLGQYALVMTGLILLSVFLGHTRAKKAEEKLIRHVADLTDAEVADD